MNNSSLKRTLLLILYGVFIGLSAGGLIWITASQPRGLPIVLLPTSTTSPITVYITGQVVHPGVYELAPGSRFKDAVNIAGGFLPEADVSGINMAALLIDSSHINVPTSTLSEGKHSGKVNINTATIAELDTLPGIGPVYAKNIVDYRQKNGLFTYIEDIQKVNGIGPALFDRIKDLISISD